MLIDWKIAMLRVCYRVKMKGGEKKWSKKLWSKKKKKSLIFLFWLINRFTVQSVVYDANSSWSVEHAERSSSKTYIKKPKKKSKDHDILIYL